MKTKAWLLVLRLLVLVLAWALLPLGAGSAETKPIRVLLVTGGHGFEEQPFFQVFKENPGIRFEAVEHPKAHAKLKAEAATNWDVLVLYDMHQEITEEARADFVARLKEGKGLVVLHHAICSYQSWPEYNQIIGARYYLQKTTVNGVEKAQSGYLHGVKFKVQVADPEHPVTRGVKEFDIHDETYKLYDVNSDCHALLTTTEPTSDKVIGWSKTYEKARVVYLQCGHDHFAYENPSFRQILKQAIEWTAGGK
jgi:uncharacterized protein